MMKPAGHHYFRTGICWRKDQEQHVINLSAKIKIVKRGFPAAAVESINLTPGKENAYG
ncbi:MAG: hypothetical protein PHW26_03460 [Eubacteriales bacterium]|nr:hypothetical protein [Eubacteriales bacterium]